MILFVGNSLRTMSGSAVRSVPLDWQGPVASSAAARQVAAGVSRQPGVLQGSAVATAPLDGSAHRGSTGNTSTGPGAVLAAPPSYLRHIRTFRLLQGKLTAGGVVLDQQMAATLQARIGDSVTLKSRAGPRRYTVTGIAIVTSPDVLFQPL